MSASRPRGSMRRSLSILLVLCGTAAADEAPQAADYFTDLTRLGVIDVKTGTADTLDAELALGEAALERGDPGAAAAVLLGIVDSPRFADFSDTIAYQNAEYDL